MSPAPFLASDGRDDANILTLSGKIPKVGSTGILSTKVSLRFSNLASPREIERSRLYRGRIDINAIALKVNQNLGILLGNVQNTSFFGKGLAFLRYSCSPETARDCNRGLGTETVEICYVQEKSTVVMLCVDAKFGC
jgi:hypothetical protein